MLSLHYSRCVALTSIDKYYQAALGIAFLRLHVPQLFRFLSAAGLRIPWVWTRLMARYRFCYVALDLELASFLDPASPKPEPEAEDTPLMQLATSSPTPATMNTNTNTLTDATTDTITNTHTLTEPTTDTMNSGATTDTMIL
ncbi:hypothetical protein K458DRAFT_393783 [Lentithecium fluviatile CBS 122367]|uniref:Uncharacterized protein n=1 Tax=Lentithecium fluviatile CBS 122367 TaxID=1168545 RepID=A0A6G1IP58_9PLEO|nr:hypothetical protein K458DRAFT_393783 [Lentithecium fluviatile CBS 122367]